MEPDKIREGTIAIFKEVFKRRTDFSETTSIDDIEEWDSLNHIILINNLEKKFNIQFDVFKLIELRKLGDFVGYINSELNDGN
jgi:acyl carrier protein